MIALSKLILRLTLYVELEAYTDTLCSDLVNNVHVTTIIHAPSCPQILCTCVAQGCARQVRYPRSLL